MKKFLFLPLALLVSCANVDEPRCWEITISYTRIDGTETDSATTFFYGTEKQIRDQAKPWLEAESKIYKTKLTYKKANNNLCL